MFWSPRSFREARHRERIYKQIAAEEALEKVQMKESKAANKLYKEKIAQEKRAQWFGSASITSAYKSIFGAST